MNEIKSLEHATLKVPYEVFNKKYRNAQRVLDVEARQVSSACTEIDNTAKNQGVTTGEIDTLLGGMVEKLTTMKRKASEAISEELQAAYICKKRLEHLKEQASALGEPSTPQVRTAMNQWRKVRLDRMLVDYFLRNGYYDSANKLADARSLRELTNVDIYLAAAEVEAELSQQRTARCLQWCADNKSKLRKLNSNMEFKIRIQEFIELVREDKRLEAVRYAKKHFSVYEEGQLEDIQHCMGMLAFPKDTEVQPYMSLLEAGRWASLVRQFRWEHARLLHPARLPALPAAMQLGLAALNTPYPFQYPTPAMTELNKVWKDRNITNRTKIHLVRTLVFPIALYGSETWTIKASLRQKIDAFEMWCWRRMLKIPWTARRTNISILQQLKLQNTPRLSTVCLHRILRYFGHIARRDDNNLERLIVTGKVEGKRPRGRSPMRWADQVSKELEIPVSAAIHQASKRNRWRQLIDKVKRSHDPQ